MCRFIVILFFIVGCSTNHEQQQIVEQGFQKERRDSLFEPIDQQILAGFLPDSIPEFVLSKKDTESTGGFGYKVSTVIGTYANPQNDKKIKLYISDASGAKSILGAGAWANLDFDKANEYTSELEGHKYYYKINKRRKKGEINLMIKNRFIVQLKGYNVDSTEMNALLYQTLRKNSAVFAK